MIILESGAPLIISEVLLGGSIARGFVVASDLAVPFVSLLALAAVYFEIDGHGVVVVVDALARADHGAAAMLELLVRVRACDLVLLGGLAAVVAALQLGVLDGGAVVHYVVILTRRI